MSVPQPTPTSGSQIRELRQRLQRMQGSAVTRTLESLPGMAGVLRLRTGGAYAVDSPSLAMALMAGPSRAGEWSAVVGAPEFGMEAAAVSYPGFTADLEHLLGSLACKGQQWIKMLGLLGRVQL